jgi:hypothetical protein
LRDHAHERAPLDAQADHDDVARLAAQKIACAVDGIDHPHARFFQSRGLVGHFLGQDGVAGKCLRQAANDERARFEIGQGHGFATGLVLYAERATFEAGDDGRGFDRHGACNF